jgi:hypothetical protein
LIWNDHRWELYNLKLAIAASKRQATKTNINE